MQRYQRGFSLVELVVAVTVILILTAIAIPNINQTMESYRLETSASAIVGKLMDARINAIKRNRPAWLAINLAAGSSQVQIANPAPPPPAANLGTLELLPRGMVFMNPPTPAQITFDSLGRIAAPQTVRLQVVRSGQQKTITVSPTGKVTVN